MSRGSDPFWCYVVGMAEGSFKCIFCGNVFAAKVSITRIKHHLAKLRGGGSRPCEEVPPHVQQAAVDNILNGSMSTWVDSMTGRNVAPGMPMPDAPETGLGTEPADQPFEMDMNNIPSSLMRDVEFSRGKEKMTWELMPSVGERGSSSKRPVDRSVPSSSNNEATNAASTPFRGLAIEQEEQPCLDEATPDVQRAAFDQLPNRMHGSMPSSEMLWLNSLMEQEILLTDENVAPGMLMPDAPETGLGTEPADQPFEMDMSNISSSLMQSVGERGSSSKRPVDRSVPSSSNNEATNAASTPARGLAGEQEEQARLDDGLGWMDNIEQAPQSFEMNTKSISSSSMMDAFLRMCRKIMSRKYKHSAVERGSSSKRPVDRSVPSSSNNEATIVEQEEPETRQRAEQAHQSFETNTKSISSSSMMDDVLRNIMYTDYMHSVVEKALYISSSESPAHKRPRTRRYFLPTSNLVVGQAFERNVKDVWSWLLNDEVSCIGIYGMGGVGKTALATHIHNRIGHFCQERRDIFHHVCWITVSQDFSIEALQDCIVEYFDLDLGDQKDAVVRAGKLWTELSVKKKYVLILDDLWDHFPLEKVGIPLRTDGCKLLFTTRSLDICTKMDCQRTLKVEPLSEGEAWNLFVEKLGYVARRLSPETKQIAESVVKECAGLPLGIRTMAGSMKGVECGGLPLGIMTMAGSRKGVDDKYRWRDALRQLRISEVGPRDMETEVFRVLRFSYAQLKDPALQKCFLHITLFPKGKITRREDLIEYLIDEGIVEEMRRHEQFDRGHTMLDQLQNASLLEGSWDDENYRYVKMHDLIWDMARKILKESLGGRVQAGAQLTELPHKKWWRKNLLIVSLMDNRIKEIPSDFSPRCPNLSTLLLCRNYKLNLVESSFFQHIIRLEVLDLSDTDIEKLPDSICRLRRLTVLLLGWCAKLSYVPSLAELTALKKLDLSYTGLENLPEGMERLKDLRYLNLDGSAVRDLQPGILPKLSKLQFLKLHQKVGVFLPVEGDEVLSLEKLETLECNFDDLEGCMPFLFGSPSLIACKVTVGRPSFSLLEDLNYTKSKSGLVKEAWFYDLMIDDASFLSQMSFTKVVIVNCQNMRILCPLMDGQRTLEILHLDGLMILETLFGAPSKHENLSLFWYLKEIVIHKCHRMKALIPPWLLSGLVCLEVIVVEDCHNMGVIMGTDEEKTFRLRRESLKVLVLKKLPELNSIYSGRLLCKSIQEITVNDCPQLTRIPLVSSYSLEKIQVDPASLRNTIQFVPSSFF